MRDKLNVDLQRILDQSTENWGIKVSTVEIKDVDLDESMIRAMAKQAEAERTRRAKIIHAEGEAQAAQQLVEAAKALALQPSALQLRYLQTLADIAHERTQLIVFPLPLDTACGAFGAHALRNQLAPERLQLWETAVRYQFFQALGLIGVGLALRSYDGGALRAAAALIVAGVVLFSGSLYALSLGAPRALGLLTPVGGLAWIGGWLSFAW